MNSISFYLASTFESRPKLREYRAQLIDLGHKVTSRWLDIPDDVIANDPNYDKPKMADVDLADVRAADVLVLFTKDETRRGGREVELGYALALNRHCVVVGSRRNVFHWHSDVVTIPDWPAAFEYLRKLKRTCQYKGCLAPFNNKPPCALCYE